MLAIFYVTRIHTCAHVCSNQFCGLLPALFVVCFMVISVAWPIQRPIIVRLMNKRVFTRATSVPATHRQVAGQNTRSSDVTCPSWIPTMNLATLRTLLVFIYHCGPREGSHTTVTAVAQPQGNVTAPGRKNHLPAPRVVSDTPSDSSESFL